MGKEDFGCPITVVEVLQDGTLTIHWKKWKEVLTQNGKLTDERIAIVTVIGQPRLYKSFVLNYIKRFLQNEGEGGMAWMKGENPEQELVGFSMNFKDEPKETAGLQIWSKPFVTETNSGKTIQVFLMDYSNELDSIALKSFALSVASAVVFVEPNEIEVDGLKEIYEERTKLEHSVGCSMFNQGSVLIFTKKLKHGFKYGEMKFEDVSTALKISSLKKKEEEALRDFFEGFSFALLPTPTNESSTEPFCGKFSQLNKDFVKHFGNSISSFAEILDSKRCEDNDVTCTSILSIIETIFRNLNATFDVQSTEENKLNPLDEKEMRALRRSSPGSSPKFEFVPGSPLTKSKVTPPEDLNLKTLQPIEISYEAKKLGIREADPRRKELDKRETRPPAPANLTPTKINVENQSKGPSDVKQATEVEADLSNSSKCNKPIVKTSTTSNELEASPSKILMKETGTTAVSVTESDQPNVPNKDGDKLDLNEEELPDVMPQVSMNDDQFKAMTAIRDNIIGQYEAAILNYFQTVFEVNAGGKENQKLREVNLKNFRKAMYSQNIPVSQDAINALRNEFSKRLKNLKKQLQKSDAEKATEAKQMEEEQRIQKTKQLQSEVIKLGETKLQENMDKYVSELSEFPTEEVFDQKKHFFLDCCKQSTRSWWFDRTKQDIPREVLDICMEKYSSVIEAIRVGYLTYYHRIKSLDFNDMMAKYANAFLPPLKSALLADLEQSLICENQYLHLHNIAQSSALTSIDSELQKRLPSYFKSQVIDPINKANNVIKETILQLNHMREKFEAVFKKYVCFTDEKFLEQKTQIFRQVKFPGNERIATQLGQFIEECSAAMVDNYKKQNRIIRKHEQEIGKEAEGKVIKFYTEHMKDFYMKDLVKENKIREHHNQTKVQVMDVFKNACDFNIESGLMSEFEEPLSRKLDEIFEKTLRDNQRRIEVASQKISTHLKIHKLKYNEEIREKLNNCCLSPEELNKIHESVLNYQIELLIKDARPYLGDAAKSEGPNLRKLVQNDFQKIKNDNDKKWAEEEEEKMRLVRVEAEKRRQFDLKLAAEREEEIKAKQRLREKEEQAKRLVSERQGNKAISTSAAYPTQLRCQAPTSPTYDPSFEAKMNVQKEFERNEASTSTPTLLFDCARATSSPYKSGIESKMVLQTQSQVSEITVGIEFGYKFIKVGALVNGEVYLLRDHNGEHATPNKVGFKEKEIFVGKDAEKVFVKKDFSSILEHKPFHESFKMWVDGQRLELRYEEFVGIILTKIKLNVRKQLNVDTISAVITVPVWLSHAQKQGIKIAGEIAGFKTTTIVSELTATAFNFEFPTIPGIYNYNNVLIVSVDEKSFDAALFEYNRNDIQIKTSSGFHHPNHNAGYTLNPVTFVKKMFLSEFEEMVKYVTQRKALDSIVVLNHCKNHDFLKQLTKLLKTHKIMAPPEDSTFIISGALKFIDKKDIKLKEATVYKYLYQAENDKRLGDLYDSERPFPIVKELDPGYTTSILKIYESSSHDKDIALAGEFQILPADEDGKFKLTVNIDKEGFVSLKARFGKQDVDVITNRPNLNSDDLANAKRRIQEMTKIGFRISAMNAQIEKLEAAKQRAQKWLEGSSNLYIKEDFHKTIQECEILVDDPDVTEQTIEALINKFTLYENCK